MPLNLDARQRAMLLEMGISVWAPAPAAAPGSVPVSAAVPAMAAPAPSPQREAAEYRSDDAPAPAAARPTPTPRAAATPPAERPAATDSAPTLRLGAPQALYPQADAAAVPAELGAAWLVVAESPNPAAPLEGDAGRLLDNMLRAMRLHQHPRVFLAALERTAGDGAASPADALQDALAAVQPAMVLLLGLPAARAALDVRDPLGRLRAGSHVLAGGTPAIVTYDPAYLLRAPDAKAGAWADLCRALVLVRDAARP